MLGITAAKWLALPNKATISSLVLWTGATKVAEITCSEGIRVRALLGNGFCVSFASFVWFANCYFCVLLD